MRSMTLILALSLYGCGEDPVLAGRIPERSYGNLMFFRSSLSNGLPAQLHFTKGGVGDAILPVEPPLGAGNRSDVTADGEWLVYETGRGSQVWVRRLRATHVQLLTPAGSCDSQPRWMEDGRRVVLMRQGCDILGTGRAMVVVDIETGAIDQLEAPAAAGGFPSPAPDGETLVWFSTGRNRGLELLDSDGALVRSVVSSPGIITTSPSFSPAGDRIAFVQEFVMSTFEDAIRVVDLNGNQLASWTLPGKGIQPAWSPDGSQLAVCIIPIVDGEVLYDQPRVEVWDLASDTKRSVTTGVGVYDCYPSWGR